VVSTHVKTDDPSNRFPGIESKEDTGDANLQPTYSQRGVKSPPHTLSTFSVKDLQTIIA
jgi:hypothetical protein